jgi:hypothetical protein
MMSGSCAEDPWRRSARDHVLTVNGDHAFIQADSGITRKSRRYSR